VAGSEDHKTYIWDLQTREIVQVLGGHTGKFAGPCTFFYSTENRPSLADIVVAVAVSCFVHLCAC